MLDTKEDEGLFGNLANPTRIAILNILQISASTPSKLSKNLKMTIQGLHRHLEILLKSGLIKKDVEGNLLLSSIGYAVLAQIPTFLFLAKYQKYFQDHDFSGIPKNLVQRLGDLGDCKFIGELMETWQTAKETAEGCGEYFTAISSIQPLEFYDTAKINLSKGTKYKIGFPANMTIASGFYEKRKESGWNDALKNSQAEEFAVKNIPVAVVITEKVAQLLFCNSKTGQIDGSSMFYSENPNFRKWCLDLFDYYYNDLEKIEHPQLKQV